MKNGTKRLAVLVRNRVAKNRAIPPQNNGLMTATWYKEIARATTSALRFDHASPNLTPARANPPAMPIGVPSARQHAAPDIVPSS